MTIVRSFRNGDLPKLLDVWLQHWSAFGPAPDVSRARFEQAILARTFFAPDWLLVAESESSVVAWCHFLPDRDTSEAATICAFCLTRQCDEATSIRLVQQVLQRMAAHGITRARAGVVRDDHFGYVGLEPTGHGIGIPAGDLRTTSALQHAGFVLARSVDRMTATTTSYRPPVSREGLQFRRSGRLQTEGLIPEPQRSAAGMSHIDIERHRLVDRSGTSMANVDLWCSDPEAEVMRPSMAILDLNAAHERGELTPAENYLVAAVLQTLEQRRIRVVETAVDSEHKTLNEQLRKLQFGQVETGAQWQATLSRDA